MCFSCLQTAVIVKYRCTPDHTAVQQHDTEVLHTFGRNSASERPELADLFYPLAEVSIELRRLLPGVVPAAAAQSRLIWSGAAAATVCEERVTLIQVTLPWPFLPSRCWRTSLSSLLRCHLYPPRSSPLQDRQIIIRASLRTIQQRL